MSWRGQRGHGGYRGHKRGSRGTYFSRDYSEDGDGRWGGGQHEGYRGRDVRENNDYRQRDDASWEEDGLSRRHRRHHGGHRGHREDHGGHRGHRQGRDHKSSWQREEYDQHGEFRERRRQRHPEGLSGKAIGMFYARKSQQKQINQTPVVTLGQQEDNLKKLLNDMNTPENDCPQPGGSDLQGSDQRPRSSYSNSKGRRGHQQRPHTSFHKVRTAPSAASSVPDFDPNLEEGNEEMEGVPNLEEILKEEKEESDVAFQDNTEDGIDAFTRQSGENRDNALDMALQTQEEEKMRTSQEFQNMMDFRKKLPSYSMMQEILNVVERNQVIVISGETGCGKTTQVPQFILDDYISKGRGSMCKLVCTQPRRISAVSVAERVASERAEKLCDSVGYSIRLESKLPRSQGSILFCTTGVLLRHLELDPELMRVSHVIIDEIHERDLQSDFLMIILKDLLPRRPDLKVILMSATLNAAAFSKYFNNCPHLNIPGFTYPVEEHYLEDALEITGYDPPEKQPERLRGSRYEKMEKAKAASLERWDLEAWCRNLGDSYSPHTIDALQRMDMEKLDLDLVLELIRHIAFNEEDGAILVFVPGRKEIKDLNQLLTDDREFRPQKFRIIPLHSQMPTMNQREVFQRPPPGVRKIVIATNIAETSITIDDVVYVIDGGKIKIKDFEPELNLTTLEPQWVSKANARQRKGRAGRVQPGKCYHLYTSLKEKSLIDYQRPEILRTRLEELCLKIKLLKLGNIERFVSKAMQAPSLEAVRRAIKTLQNLQALDHNEELLPLGFHLARMPLDPHTGKMILFAAMFGCLDPVCTVAASLSFKDAFVVPLGKEREADERKRVLANGTKSDHLMLINAFQLWERHKRDGTDGRFCWNNFLSANTLRLLKEMKWQFGEILQEMGFTRHRDIHHPDVNINSDNLNLIKAVICAGLYPNVAQIRSNKRATKLHLSDKRKVYIHPSSVNAKETNFSDKWMMYHTMMKTESVNVFDCSPISPYPLLFFGGEVKTSTMMVEGEERHMVTVDDWISFFASPSIGQLVKDLRRELDILLEKKITSPGMINWDPQTKEGALIHAIKDLISTQETECHHGNRKESSHGYWE